MDNTAPGGNTSSSTPVPGSTPSTVPQQPINLTQSPQIFTNQQSNPDAVVSFASQPPPPEVPLPKPRSFKKIIIIGIIVLILLLVIGATAYGAMLFLSQKSDVAVMKTTDQSTTGEKNTEKQTEVAKQKVTRSINAETLTIFSKEELEILGIISLPEGFSVQEEYKGVKLVRTPKASFSSQELGLIHRFIDATPKKLLAPGPSAIVTFATGEVPQTFSDRWTTIAFASGSYIFFNATSFKGGFGGGFTSDNSINLVTATFEHELTHVAQFNASLDTIANEDFQKLAKNGTAWTDIVQDSVLFSDYAGKVGWKKTTENGKTKWNLENKETAVTSEYGKTAIFEDMAEAVSGMIMTQDYEYSKERQDWAHTFLGETYESLKPGKFPFSKDFTLVRAFLPMIDYTKKDEYKSKYKLVEQQTYENDVANSVEGLKVYFETEMTARGWQGAFTKQVKSDGVEVYKADFVGNQRDMYIEMRTYDNATGYSQKPTGTEINVITGYNI